MGNPNKATATPIRIGLTPTWESMKIDVTTPNNGTSGNFPIAPGTLNGRSTSGSRYRNATTARLTMAKADNNVKFVKFATCRAIFGIGCLRKASGDKADFCSGKPKSERDFHRGEWKQDVCGTADLDDASCLGVYKVIDAYCA